MTQFKAFSAPGKALLAGGYLVLDKEFSSYVVALSSRMHSVIRSVDEEQVEGSKIVVKSPQFAEGEWEYHIRIGSEGSFEIVEVQNRKNPFVLNTIETILYYIHPASSQKFNLEINIFSDSGYHSAENTIAKNTAKKPFLYHSKPITEVAKTGLGSSAGLVTVLTTALLSFFLKDFNLNSSSTLNKIHNLAQVAHCHAQGKVGSGFDVAAATFGSIVYKRFDPILINALPQVDETNGSKYHEILVDLIDSTNWEIRNDKVSLPNGIKLIMGDVKTGSNTPKLVSKVLKWRSEDPESSMIYNELNDANMSLVQCLNELNEIGSTESYTNALNFIKNHDIEEILNANDSNLELFERLISSVKIIRKNLREITKRSGADIEPLQQTLLLDKCSTIPGVLAGVVPGAGGYDAISLLITEDSIANLKEQSKNNEDFNGVEWLELSEESNGIQSESEDDYLELI